MKYALVFFFFLLFAGQGYSLEKAPRPQVAEITLVLPLEQISASAEGLFVDFNECRWMVYSLEQNVDYEPIPVMEFLFNIL